ncbi:hypothetical protein [Dyadobacter sp. NIV53]|uniref:hypothetical protein n=1 Tax=Dyadobacter sp. NIV53 TaxID=2861765 RepID=UPI001C881BEE|nr:hypothetical protein [Dyadobacter sp. NIV53]
MDIEDNEFLKFVEAAGKNDLEYLLIGGLALAMHGIQRYTSDADVWIQPTNNNKDNLINTLLALGYESDDIQYIRELDFTEAQIVRLEGPIDILTRIHFRMEYEICRARAREFISAVGFKIFFFHINDLRESKILARRPKDLNDVLMIDELIKNFKSSEDN